MKKLSSLMILMLVVALLPAFAVAQKAPAGRRQGGAGAVADKQFDPEVGFQVVDAGADRGLGDMQPGGSLEETAIGRHGEKGPNLINIHDF